MATPYKILSEILEDAKHSIPELIRGYIKYPSFLVETPMYPDGVQTGVSGILGATEGMFYGFPAGLLLKNGFIVFGAPLTVAAIRFGQALYSKKKLELEEPRRYSQIYSQ